MQYLYLKADKNLTPSYYKITLEKYEVMTKNKKINWLNKIEVKNFYNCCERVYISRSYRIYKWRKTYMKTNMKKMCVGLPKLKSRLL